MKVVNGYYLEFICLKIFGFKLGKQESNIIVENRLLEIKEVVRNE